MISTGSDSIYLFLNHKVYHNKKIKMLAWIMEGGGTMCGDLLCPMRYSEYVMKKCMRWVGGSFVKATVTLAENRQHHLCWARHNGVRLLGGNFSPKGRFSRSSK